MDPSELNSPATPNRSLRKYSSTSSSSGDEEIIRLNPFNPVNRLITRSQVQSLLKAQGISLSVKQIEIYQRAFVHKSYCGKKERDQKPNVELVECPEGVLPLQPHSNERLEYLGDAVINCIIGKYLYERYEDQDEGFLTRIRTKLVRGETLANFAEIIKLSQHLIISRHVEDKCNGRRSPRFLEDAFEALIGAIFLDFNEYPIKKYRMDFSGLGFQVAEQFLINLVESNIDFTRLILLDTNYKDQLLRFYQQRFGETPKYKEISANGPPHSRIFTMAVLDPKNKVAGTGQAKSKKKAEQLASRRALIRFGVLDPADVLEDTESD